MIVHKKISLLVPLLFITGCASTGSNQEVTISYPENKGTVFERGKYHKTKDGFYISNLTPAPIVAAGCDMPINTADLTAPRSEQGDIFITEVDVDCEES